MIAMSTLKIKKLHENAVIPQRATSGSAGMDLYAVLDEPITLKQGETALIPTGIAIALESPSEAAFIFPRSGLSIKHGIGLLNSVGVIDSDYRGELMVCLHNHSNTTQTIENGERIAQISFVPYYTANFELVDELDDTERGTGGFGSTGTK
mgnify:CR=1 FL=1